MVRGRSVRGRTAVRSSPAWASVDSVSTTTATSPPTISVEFTSNTGYRSTCTPDAISVNAGISACLAEESFPVDHDPLNLSLRRQRVAIVHGNGEYEPPPADGDQ